MYSACMHWFKSVCVPNAGGASFKQWTCGRHLAEKYIQLGKTCRVSDRKLLHLQLVTSNQLGLNIPADRYIREVFTLVAEP